MSIDFDLIHQGQTEPPLDDLSQEINHYMDISAIYHKLVSQGKVRQMNSLLAGIFEEEFQYTMAGRFWDSHNKPNF